MEDYNKCVKNRQIISILHNDNADKSISKETKGSRYKGVVSSFTKKCVIREESILKNQKSAS